MLRELLAYIRTPAPEWARSLGFVHELVSIESLWSRYAAEYETHRLACRKAILGGSEDLLRKQRAVVLGAGAIHDVPLEELAHQFSEVFLVDCVFSRQTQRAARELPNVELVTHDLAGVCQRLRAARKGDPLPAPEELLPAKAERADYIVSLNLLSQLAITPVDYARRKNLAGDVDAWGRRIEQAHLDALRKLHGRVLLVSDFERHRHRKSVLEDEVEETLYVELPEPDTFWKWDIRPDKDSGYALCVGSWLLP